jgi:hypothetical protein
MSKTIRITYYGVDGEGPTVTAAKQDAGRRLEHLVKQTEEPPVIIMVEGEAAILGFTKYGWGHRCFMTARPAHAVLVGTQWLSGGFATKHEAELYALKHVLDNAWNFPPDDEAWFNDATNGVAKCGVSLTTSEARRIRGEFLAQCKWQRGYRRYRDEGYNDEDARYMCSGLNHLVKRAPQPEVRYNLDGDVDDRADHSGAVPATDRPGDAAAVLHEETGIDYATCLVMTNTD